MSSQSTCVRGNVSCIGVDKKYKVLATGYNGVPPGFAHCNAGIGHNPAVVGPFICEGVIGAPHGTDKCKAIHAEENLVSQCKDTERLYRVYSTHSPCKRCAGLLLTTGITELHYAIRYDDNRGAQILYEAGIKLIDHPVEEIADCLRNCALALDNLSPVALHFNSR